MKRSNTAFIISLIIHILGALILMSVHRSESERRGKSSIAVQFDVKTPEPRLEKKKPKFEPVDLRTPRRSVSRQQSMQVVKIDQKMDNTKAYRDVAVTDESENPIGMEASEDGVNMGNLLPNGSGAIGSGRGIRGGRSQLVEFVDKSKGKRDIVYCMDVSASMGAANKLNLARNYLKDSLIALNEKRDRFNVIVFSKNVRVFRPDGLVPATRENMDAAMYFLDDFTPTNIKQNTKTDLLAPLMKAMEMDPSIIALVTDGLPTSGETNPEKILQNIRQRNADGKFRIFAIGMEMDMEQPEAWLMRAIADQNSGEFQFF